jgi:hypothetical protein
MIIFWIINIALWVAFAWYNYAFIYRTRDFHTPGVIVSCFIALLAAYASTMNISMVWYYQILSLGFITLTARWVFFDLFFNYLCNKPWWYYGNTTKGLLYKSKPYYKNGSIDRMFGLWQIPIKIIFLIISLYLSICIL